MKKIVVVDCLECPLISQCTVYRGMSRQNRVALMLSPSFKGILRGCPLPDDSPPKPETKE